MTKKNSSRKHSVPKKSLSAASGNSSHNGEGYPFELNLPAYVPWLIFGLLIIVYYLFSTFSNGFYQHDEVGHFLNMQNFWSDHSAILTTWAKPGFKIVYVVPALLGSNAVLILNCLFAALASLVSYFVAKEYGLKNAVLTMFFCGFQPMLYQVAFRNYSELLTAFCIALLLLFYAKERHILVALTASYLFALRQELALIAIILGVIYLFQKRFIPFIALGAAPVILNLIGWINTGNPIYLIDQIFGSGAPGEYRQLGFFHFWEMFTPAIGTTVTLFFLFGYLGFIPLSKDDKLRHLKKYHMAYIVFTVYFLSICLFTEEAFTFLKLTGNLRQLVVVSPVIAVFATVGFNKLQDRTAMGKLFIGSICLLFFLLVAKYMSFEYNHLKYTEVREASKVFVLLLTFVFIGLIYFRPRWTPMMAICLALLTAGHAVYAEKPYKLSAEDRTLKEVADWFQSNNMKERDKVIVNHTMFHYYAGTTGKDRISKYQKITPERLEQMPSGGICIWDSHYSYRPTSSSEPGVPLDFFRGNQEFRMLKNFIPPERNVQVVVLEKI